MYKVNKWVCNVATCWGFFGKTNNLIGLIVRPLIMYPVLCYAIVGLVGLVCQMYYVMSGQTIGLFSGITWYAFVRGFLIVVITKLLLCIVSLVLIGIVYGVRYLYKLLCEKVIRKFEFVVNSGDNDMKLDGNVEKKPMLKESDETPVLSEVVTDETKPVEAPVEDKKPL